MTIVAVEDNRNLEWRSNNKGASLLEKMGWKEGDGIGRRTKSDSHALRALKRKEGLGLGAKIQSEGGSSDRSDHFSAVLKNLHSHHAPSKSEKKKSKKSKGIVLAQNKVTAGHAKKMREAKFGKKSSHELACIFGNSDFTPIVVDNGASNDELEKEAKRLRKLKRKEEKKRRKLEEQQKS
eukprot:Nitzschia sp. Nitz4//scaffold16_size188269//168310//168849//NITZ4_001816-RA/size188269-processed-gene-0.29-mRNA-1//1//CDS//3329538592//6014//frame0